MGAQLRTPHETSQTITGLRGALNWAYIMPTDISLSESYSSDHFFFFQSNHEVSVLVKTSVHDGTEVPATWSWNQKLFW